MAFVVKMNLGTDFRRQRFRDASEVTFEAIIEMVRASFGPAPFLATFRDDDGNSYTLSARTLPDALGRSSGTLRLTIHEMLQIDASSTAQPRPTAGSLPQPSGNVRFKDGHDTDLAQGLDLSLDEFRSKTTSEKEADEHLARALAESSREHVCSRAKAEMEADEDLARILAESERIGHSSSIEVFTTSRPDREQCDTSQRGHAREKCHRLLDSLGLKVIEAGSTNYSESDRLMTNQCFYLALARSFLGPSGLVQDVALAFKRIIEHSVLKEHPEWRKMGQVGECEQAYADFLVSPMRDRSTDFAEIAVVLVDSTTGCAEVFKGIGFDAAVTRSRSKATKNVLLLWYVPGHYQALGAGDARGSKPLLTLERIVDALDREGLGYVESCC